MNNGFCRVLRSGDLNGNTFLLTECFVEPMGVKRISKAVFSRICLAINRMSERYRLTLFYFASLNVSLSYLASRIRLIILLVWCYYFQFDSTFSKSDHLTWPYTIHNTVHNNNYQLNGMG